MRRMTLLAAFSAALSVGASAQTSSTAPTRSPGAPADKNAPLPGANSFTEGQAKSRLEANGYTNAGLRRPTTASGTPPPPIRALRST